MALLECFKPIEPNCKINCANCQRFDIEKKKCGDEDMVIRGKK